MKGLFYVLSLLGVLGLAYWTYRENYATQSAIAEVGDLHDQLGAAHARLRVLNAEWAYLNRPERLSDLTRANYKVLGLLPLSADSFGRVDQVAFPLPDFDPEAGVTVQAIGVQQP